MVEERSNTIRSLGGDRQNNSDRTPLPHLNIDVFLRSDEFISEFRDLARDRVSARIQIDVHMGGVASACRLYADNPTPNVVFLELETDNIPYAFTSLETFADLCDSGTKVIILGHNNDVAFYRELIARGVSEYLLLPVHLETLIDTLYKLFSEKTQSKGRIVAVCGTKGGVGASTVAHHLAYAMAELSDTPTLLVDLDIAFGTAALTFDQSPTKGIAELLFASQFDIGGMMERLSFSGGGNLNVIGTGASLYRVFDVSPAMVDNLVQHIRDSYRLAILDVPHQWSEWIRFLLSDANDIVLVTAPDIPSLRNTKAIADALVEARPNDPMPRIVLNMVGMLKRQELRLTDFEKASGLTIHTTIPHSPEMFSQATNEGTLIFGRNQKSKETKIFYSLAQDVLDAKPAMKKSSVMGPLLSKFTFWKI
jgi:pilus assembly protein CpaE